MPSAQHRSFPRCPCWCSFLDAAELEDSGLKGPLRTLREASLFTAYNAVMGVEALRRGAGATPGTRDTPADLCDVDLQARGSPQQGFRPGFVTETEPSA